MEKLLAILEDMKPGVDFKKEKMGKGQTYIIICYR